MHHVRSGGKRCTLEASLINKSDEEQAILVSHLAYEPLRNSIALDIPIRLCVPDGRSACHQRRGSRGRYGIRWVAK